MPKLNGPEPMIVVGHTIYRLRDDRMLQRATIEGAQGTPTVYVFADVMGDWDEECTRAEEALIVMTEGADWAHGRALRKVLTETGLAIGSDGTVEKTANKEANLGVRADIALARAIYPLVAL